MSDVSKFFLKSKTIQGVLTMLIPLLFRAFGVEIVDAETTQIAEAVTVLLGAVWAIIGRAKASGGLSVSAKVSGRARPETLVVLLALAAALLMCGCATWQSATPVEKARIVGAELSGAYVDMHAEYLATYQRLGEEGQAVMASKVAPVMDAAKRALILYNDAAVVWSRTGEEPEGMEGLDRSVRSLLADAGALLAEVAVKYMSKEE